MKIRQGFVSNSSSSSFAVIGVKVEGNAMGLIKNILGIKDEDIFQKMSEEKTTDTIEEFCHYWLAEILDDEKIDMHCLQDDDEHVIGRYLGSWEYDSIEVPAQEAIDDAKKIVEKAGLSVDDMKIFCCFSV
jgi:hypothetical protein